jgi:hypothetical protein
MGAFSFVYDHVVHAVFALLALCAGCDYALRIDRVAEVNADARGPDAEVVPFAYVQSNWHTAADEAFAAVDFINDQIAGDLNVVIVGWAAAPDVVITDDRNNVYQVAQTARTQNSVGQTIYYAENIAGGPNKVSVAFQGGSATFPDIRILEYAGPVREGAFLGGTTKLGTGTGMSSDPLRVDAPHALLVAGFTVGASTTDGGAGYTERINTDHGDYVEDMVITAPGSYSATATQSGATAYIVQLVAFALP